MVRILVQADDFSGAAEVGQQFTAEGFGVQIALAQTGSRRCRAADGTEVVVLDTHSRSVSPDAAANGVKAALGSAGPAGIVFKKTDSLWRGNVGGELRALADLGFHVVLAGALPAMGRTVLAGRPLTAGLPLHGSDFWRAEPRRAPEHLSELFPTDSRLRYVGLDAVRSPALAHGLGRALRGHVPVVVVVDGETEADLAAVADAVVALRFASAGRPVALAGTGQLAGILARRLAQEVAPSAHAPAAARGSAASPARPVLAVVGSASPVARGQLAHLAAEGLEVLFLPSPEEGTEDESATGARLRAALTEGRSIALSVPDAAVDPARAAGIVDRLASLAGQAQQGVRADLILTGGETAREVLEAVGIASLVPLTAVQHGAVVCMADDGRLVATKPGSFGDPVVLAQLYRALQSPAHLPVP